MTEAPTLDHTLAPAFPLMLFFMLGYVLALLALLYAGTRRLKNLLHYFQQEEYDSVRFARWWLVAPGFDKRLSFCLLLAFLWALLVQGGYEYWLATLLLLLAGRAESNPQHSTKKPLVMTARATRIFRTATALFILLVLALFLTAFYAHSGASQLNMAWLWLGLILAVQLLPDTLIIANFLLRPFEAYEQRRYRREAEAKLAYLRPTVIGITGSFGKTSTKHFLFHILAAAAPTLMTPGSVNTIMGITRVVREQLRPEHRFFVVEMGDYAPGAVAEKCAFIPPTISAITAVGIEHFERFKSMAAIAKTKFEIAEDVWARGGVCVINGTQLDAAARAHLRQPALTRLIVDTPPTAAEKNAFYLHDIQQSVSGLNFKLLLPNGTLLTARTPLFGEQHASNLAVAIVLALELGVPANTIIMALQDVPQTKHRLEVKHQPNSYTLIDDAYNSNPAGFAAALQVLDLIGQHKKQTAPTARRILLTPGMVELGELHESEHARLGALAAQKCDWLIAVNPVRFHSFVSAARQQNPGLRIDEVPNLAAARALLEQEVAAADTVLFENDLPELYEQKPRF